MGMEGGQKVFARITFFGLVEIRFIGEVTAGRVVFGPDDVEPLLRGHGP